MPVHKYLFAGRGKGFGRLEEHLTTDADLTLEDQEHARHIGHLIGHWCEEHSTDHIDVELSLSVGNASTDESITEASYCFLTITTTREIPKEFHTLDASYEPEVPRSLYTFDGFGKPNHEVWLLSTLTATDEKSTPLYYFSEDEYGPDREPTTKGEQYEAAGWHLYTGDYKNY